MRSRHIAAAALVLCGGVCAAPRATIELLPRATVGGETVTLGDLAHVSSTDLELVRKLIHLPVGLVPQEGRSAVVKQPALAAWVDRKAGVMQEHLRWTGVHESRVERTRRRLRGEEIGQVAVDALRAWLTSQGVAGDVQLAATPRDLDLPAGELRLQVRPPGRMQLRRRSVAWVDAWAGDAFVRTVPVALEVTGTPALVPMSHHADGGLPLQLAGHPDDPMRGGEPGLAVERGEWASLRSGAGAIELESRVEVLQDGRPGQRVRVRQPGAVGVVFARVIGRGRLELAP